MSRTRYGLALASAATLASVSCGALVGAASAEPGRHPHGGDHGRHLGQSKHGAKSAPGSRGQSHGSGHDSRPDDGESEDRSPGHAYGHDQAPGQTKDHQPAGQGNGEATGQGDPLGNNGTVKIAAPSDAVGHVSNNPHPGCTVVVEWFGYDAGDDVVSTVTFAPQAPTSDVTIGGTSPASVFVGGDAASGGTDLDGRQAYALTFDGEPHPKQGYHVKLTVATPHSLGNDTKTKVFWVQPCETAGPTSTDTPDMTGGTTGQGTGRGDSGRGTSSHQLSAPGTPASDVDEPLASVDEPGSTGVADRTAAVPTAVDAGENAWGLPDWARSPLPLAAVAGGLALVAAGIARRAQPGA